MRSFRNSRRGRRGSRFPTGRGEVLFKTISYPFISNNLLFMLPLWTINQLLALLLPNINQRLNLLSNLRKIAR